MAASSNTNTERSGLDHFAAPLVDNFEETEETYGAFGGAARAHLADNFKETEGYFGEAARAAVESLGLDPAAHLADTETEGYGKFGEAAAWTHSALVALAPALLVALLATRKGGRAHRLLGWAWCALLAAVAASAVFKVVGRTELYGRSSAAEMRRTRLAVACFSAHLTLQGVYAVRAPRPERAWNVARWWSYAAVLAANAAAFRERVRVGADPVPYAVLPAFASLPMLPYPKEPDSWVALARHVVGTVMYASFSSAFTVAHHAFSLATRTFLQSDLLFLEEIVAKREPWGLVNPFLAACTLGTTAWYLVPVVYHRMTPSGWSRRAREKAA